MATDSSLKHNVSPVSFKAALLRTLSGGPLFPESFTELLKRCVQKKDTQTSQGEPAGLWAVLVQRRPKLLRCDSDLASGYLSLFTKENPTRQLWNPEPDA